MRSIKYFTFFILSIIFLNCSNDKDTNEPDPNPIEDALLTENVEVYNGSLIDDDYVLAVENGSTTSYLLDKAGNKINKWTFENNLGNDLEILPNGKLIGMFKTPNPDFTIGGFGGNIKIINPDGSIDWEFTYSSTNYLAHHDVEMLPNGNVLFMTWDRISSTIFETEGVANTVDIFPEALIEVNPNTDEIVWEWHSFDHIIQDQFPSANNYGVVNENPQLIDINYNAGDIGDITHGNGIDYDPVNDVIYLSVNFYSEVWVLDHSTSSAEAALHSGGNYNKGGDLVYRFGNPQAYKNTFGERLFYNNHFPNFLEENEPGAGHVLIFNNGANIEQSTVYELIMPQPLSLIPNFNNEPEIAWSFTNPNLFYDRISGAVRLPNGNTLIAEGDYGIWEVTPSGEIVWKYNNLGPNIWRCYSYPKDSPEITNLGIEQ